MHQQSIYFCLYSPSTHTAEGLSSLHIITNVKFIYCKTYCQVTFLALKFEKEKKKKKENKTIRSLLGTYHMSCQACCSKPAVSQLDLMVQP